jgi:8-oxo-dGTP diphosphatase
MISNQPFEGFNPKFHVVGCFIEHEGDILLIKRHPSKDNGDKWAGPSGKIDKGETDLEAMVRETREETGLDIDPNKLIFVEHSYVRFPTFDFTYRFFKYILTSSQKPKIILNKSEHTAYQWIKPKAALKEDLMQDEDYCIKAAYHI